MQATSLPATAGWYWIRQGYQLFRRHPLPLFTWMMFLPTMLMVLLLGLGPLSLFVAQLFIPCLTVMTFSGCRVLAGSQPMHLSAWIQPLRVPGVTARLLAVGGLQLCLIQLAALLAFTPFSDQLAAELERTISQNDLMPFLDALRLPAILFGLQYAGISALFWFTPILVAWHQLPVTRAIFFSLVACWRNKWAFLVYIAIWGVLLSSSLIITNILALALPGIGPALAIISMAFIMFAASVWYCSAYVNYVTIFGVRRADDNSNERNDVIEP